MCGLGSVLFFHLLNPGANSVRKGQKKYFHKHYEEAIPYYLEAIQAGSKISFVYLHLAESYTITGNFNEAIYWYKIYLQKNPKDLSIRLELAKTLNWAKRPEEAKREFEAILKENHNE